MKKYGPIFLIAILTLIGGCENKNQDKATLENLSRYLMEVHSFSLENTLYIMIPSDSCDGCRQIVYRNLLTTRHEKNITLIMVGQVLEARTNSALKRLEIMGVKILYDEVKKAQEFDLIHKTYPMSMVSFIDIKSMNLNYEKVLLPSMINGGVDIRKDFFNNYIL